MPVVEESVVLPRPPEEVFAYLSQAQNVPQWDTSVVEAEQIDPGPLSVGTRWRGQSTILGRRLPWVTEVTEVDAPRTMTSRSVEGRLTFAVRYHLEPQPGGTLLTYRVEAESGLGGAFGRFADPLVQSAQGRTVRANLRRLATLLGSERVR